MWMEGASEALDARELLVLSLLVRPLVEVML